MLSLAALVPACLALTASAGPVSSVLAGLFTSNGSAVSTAFPVSTFAGNSTAPIVSGTAVSSVFNGSFPTATVNSSIGFPISVTPVPSSVVVIPICGIPTSVVTIGVGSGPANATATAVSNGTLSTLTFISSAVPTGTAYNSTVPTISVNGSAYTFAGTTVPSSYAPSATISHNVTSFFTGIPTSVSGNSSVFVSSYPTSYASNVTATAATAANSTYYYFTTVITITPSSTLECIPATILPSSSVNGSFFPSTVPSTVYPTATQNASVFPSVSVFSSVPFFNGSIYTTPTGTASAIATTAFA